MLKLNGRIIDIGRFPDGTLLIKETVPKDFVSDRSAKISRYFDNNEELVALIYIVKHLKAHGEENLMMFYPDEGAMKRYSALADKPYAFGIKKRDWATGRKNVG